MLTYDLSKFEGPLYQRIYEAVKRDIHEGKLTSGTKLPSKRALARNLGVSAITVENAHDQLIAEGYLVARPRRGYFVAEVEVAKRPARTIERELRIEKPRRDWAFDFSSNKTESANFPFSVWAKCLRDAMTRRKNDLLETSPCAGVLELREAIARHLASFRGMAIDPDQIVVGPGAEYLYGLLVRTMGRDKIFCVENPGYKKLRKIYESFGVDCRLARVDDRGIIPEELRESGADVAHISPTRHFPTGTTTPVSRRFEILAWATETEGRYVIEDDYDSEFRMKGRPLPSMQSLDPDRVVYVNTFSKSLASTIRIGYAVLPPELIERYYKRLSFYSCAVSTFEQYALAAFIGRGYFEKHINRLRLHYSRKRARVLETVRGILPETNCRPIERDSGLAFILKLSTERSESEIKEELASQGIRIETISDYDAGDSGEYRNQFLLNYSNLDETRLEGALRALREAL